MKKCLFVPVFIVFLMGRGFSQHRYAQADTPHRDKKVEWQNVVVQDLLGIGKRSLLIFNNAQYDFSRHFFPLYSERIAMPSGAGSMDVKIINEVFQPLSDSEKVVINGYDFQNKNVITEDVTPSVTISYYKKQPYAYLQFIPIRKNNTTGNYEKLVFFSLQVVSVYNSNKVNFVPKTYTSNSVLASGKWHKIGVASDGIYKMDYAFLKNKLGWEPRTKRAGAPGP